MIAATVEFAAGLALAIITLRDVFGTVVVPGRTHGLLRISRRFVFLALPVWKRMTHRGIGVGFGPGILVTAFVSWMLLLIAGFGLMAHAVGDSFSPPLTGFGQALFVAASDMTTIGTGTIQSSGLASVVVSAAGFCGLSVMTLAVTYLLEVQSNIAQRDTGVLKMTTVAGKPPSALALLERYAQLGCPAELGEILRSGREWCAGMLQSHLSHPSLIYFRSAGTDTGWPATPGTLMDAALIFEYLVEAPDLRGPAVLVREEADRLAGGIAALLSLDASPDAVDRESLDHLCGRLAAAGYRLRESRDVEAFMRQRALHLAPVTALSHHLGTDPAPLLPGKPAG